MFGFLLINILGNHLPVDTTAFVSTAFPVLLFISFIWMPESPAYLIRKKRNEEAEATLLMLRGKEEAVTEMKRILKEQLVHSQGSVKDLFSNKINRKAAIIAYGLRTIQQFSGATALTFYCKTIFEESNSVIHSNVLTLIYFSLQLIVAFTMLFIVDKLGRKPLLLVSVIGTAATLLVLAFYLILRDETNINTDYLNFVPIVSLLANAVFFSIGIRNVPLLMMSEVFSPNIKSVALSFGTIYYSVIAFLSAKIFFILKETFGMYASFLLYGFLTLLSAIFIKYIVPETKGLNLEEIQKLLSDPSLEIGKIAAVENKENSLV